MIISLSANDIYQGLFQGVRWVYLQQIFLMEPKSTVQNSLIWRIWHGINYFIGGGTFLVGSFVLFPNFTQIFAKIDTAQVSAWLYTIGSLTFLLADLTQWLHYTKINCPFLQLSINFFASATGSTLYLIGSAFFIPALKMAEQGAQLFIIGSAVIVFSQVWKICRGPLQEGKTFKQLLQEDASGFYVDLFAGLGGAMYFIGTFLFQAVGDHPDYMIPAVTLYTLGGLFFFASGIFMQKRYFLQPASTQGYSLATSASVEI